MRHRKLDRQEMEISMSQSRMKFSRAALVGVATLTLYATATMSNAADPMTTATGGNVAKDDRTFVEKATIGGMTEIEASKLVPGKGASADVKKYGAQMVSDHTTAAEKLTKIATAKGITPPGTLDKSHKSDIDKLSQKSGADFDKAYMKQMVSDHKTVVSLFEKEARDGKDADLKTFATTTLPTLQDHLKMAQQINDTLK
jgi:putative membrane protein